MADNYTTRYVFELEVRGQAALEQAKTYRAEIEKALSVDAGQAMPSTDAAAKSTDKSLTALRSTITGLSTVLNSGSIAWDNYTSQLKKAATAASSAVTAITKTSGTSTTAARGLGGYAASIAKPGLDALGMPLSGNQIAASAAYGAPKLAETGGYAASIAKPGFDALGMAIPMTKAETDAIQQANAALAAQQKVLQRNSSSWGAFSAAVQESSRDLWTVRRLSYDFEKWGRSMMVGGLAIEAGMYSMSNSFVQFDESATRAAMAMRLTSDLTDDLRTGVKQASIDVAKFSPEEISEGLRLWAAGTGEVVQSQSQLNRMLEDTVEIQKLAAINNVEFSQTVDDVGGIMHEFGMQTEDVGRIASVLNFVAAESFANVDDLGQAFKMVGPLANELGVSFETTASALAMMSDNNVKGTMAGRALRQVFLSLLDPTAKTTANMNKLLNVNESLGESWRDLIFPNEQFVGLAETFDILAASTENMTDAQRAELAALLQNANAVPAFITMLNNQNEARRYGINGMRAYEKVMTGVMDAEVVAYKRMYEETTGLPFSLEGAMAKMTNMWDEFERSDSARAMRLKQRWHVAILDMGEPITESIIPKLEKLMGVMERIVQFAADNPGLLDAMLVGAGGLVTLGVALDVFSKGLSAWYLAGTLVPGFKAFAAAKTAGAVQATLPGFAAAGTAGAGGAAGLVASIGPIVVSVLGAAAVVAAVAVLARKITKEQREQGQEAVERLPEEVQAKFQAMFKPNFLGTAYTTTTAEGKALLEELRKEGLLGPAPISASGALALSTREFPNQFPVEEIGLVLRYIATKLKREAEFNILRPLANARLEGDFMSGRAQRSGDYVTALSAETPRFTEERQSELITFHKYQQARAQMVADFDTKRRQIQSDYAEWVAQSEQNLNQRIGSMYTDYIQSRSRAAEDLERNIAEASQSAYKQSEDAARSHYENLRNMQIAHAQRMVDLLESRDVQGITKEMRSYETQTEQQNRSFAQQQQKSQADLADRLAKMQEDARLKEIRDEEDYNNKVIQMREDLKAEIAARDRERIAAIKTLNAEQATALQDLGDDLIIELYGLETLLAEEYDRLNKGLEGFLLTHTGMWAEAAGLVGQYMRAIITGDYAASSRAGGEPVPVPPTGWDLPNYAESSGGRAMGGYVDSGFYRLHSGEFVLNPMTTKDLESRYGHLSQNTFKDTMGAQQFIFSPTFNGMGAQDKMWFRRAAEQVFDEKMATLQRRVR